jgi:hypothetical protein
MSLKSTLRKAVKSAFKALDDLPQQVTYTSVQGAPVRDLDSGTFTVPHTDYTLPLVVFTKFTDKELERDPALQATDMKMLFPAEDLPVEPKPPDTVIDAENVKWSVIKRMRDPAKVLGMIQVRAT